MTLREALEGMNLRIGCPVCLEDLEIKNFADLDRHLLLNYFQSPAFRNDLDTAILDVQEGIDHGYDSFVIVITQDQDDRLYMRIDLADLFTDSIDTYQ